MSAKFQYIFRDRARWLTGAFCFLCASAAALWAKWLDDGGGLLVLLLSVIAGIVTGYFRLKRGTWLTRENPTFRLYLEACSIVILERFFTVILMYFCGDALSLDGAAAVAIAVMCLLAFFAPPKASIIPRRTSAMPGDYASNSLERNAMLAKFLEVIRDRDRWVEVAFCLVCGLAAQVSKKWLSISHLEKFAVLAVLLAIAWLASGYVRLRRGYGLNGKSRTFDLYLDAIKVMATVWLFTGVFQDSYGHFLSDDGVAAVATLAVCVMVFVAPKKDLLITRLSPSSNPPDDAAGL